MTTTAPTRVIRSTHELADRLGWDVPRMLKLLEESEEMGVIETCAGGWRLTTEADALYGPGLREFGP